MIEEIITHLKEDSSEIAFRTDGRYFGKVILDIFIALGCMYVIKPKDYWTLIAQTIDPSIVFVTDEAGFKKLSLLKQ